MTQTIPEDIALPCSEKIILQINSKPKGYGANQNAAFLNSQAPFFCVLNPDISLKENPFPSLLSHFSDDRVALVGPKILSPEGAEEDSARREPTFRNLVLKALGQDNGTYSPKERSNVLHPDWLAGMFLLMRREVLSKIGGFDEKYFLYYEDVDLCKRLHLSGYEIIQDRSAEVTHDARRASRKNWGHARWHLASMMRYLLEYRAW